MTIYGALNIFDAAISVLLAIVVLIKGKNKNLVLPLSYWILTISIWSFGVGMHAFQDKAGNFEAALFWSRFLHYGAVFIPAFYTHFVFEITRSVNKKALLFIYLFSIALCFLIPFPVFIKNLSPVISFQAFPKAGIFYPAFVVFLFSCVNFSIYRLYTFFKKAEGIEKNQIQYMIVTSCITFGLGTTAFLPMFDVPIFPFGTPFVALNPFIITFTILRYRLMEFGLLIRWGIAYTLLTLTLAIPIVLVLYSLEWISRNYLLVNPGITTLLIICLLVFIYEPLRQKITHFVDQIIFRSPDFKSILLGIENSVKQSQNLPDLGEDLSVKLKNIWEVEHAGLAIWDYKFSSFSLFPENEFTNQIITQLHGKIDKSDFLSRTLETERRLFPYGIAVEAEITALGNRAFPGEKITFWKIRRTMRWLGAAACVPLMAGEQLIGFIILGQKKNQTLYNDEDKKFLSHVATMISGSIENLSASIGVQKQAST